MENLSGRSFGAYEILEPLGEGGMAAVYRAYQPSVERYVAVKVLPRLFANDPTFVARFRREARVVAQLQHPHILPVFDYGESDGYTYFVMPLVSGGTLADRVAAGIPAIGQTRIWIAQVARALGYAHQRGVIHRDVKPSNVLLDESDNCLLSDFGITHIAETSKALTTTGTVIGTPMYMAPEQGLGQAVDARTDVYALGIVLFQLVTGRVPYDADTPLATMLKHISDPLPSARALNPACPESMERIILKALAKRRDDRYESAVDMARALEALDPESLKATPPPGGNAANVPTVVLVEPPPIVAPRPAGVTGAAAGGVETTVGAVQPAEATRVMGAPAEPKSVGVSSADSSSTRPGPGWRRYALPGALVAALILVALGAMAISQRPAAAPDPTPSPRLTVTTALPAVVKPEATQAPQPTEPEPAEPPHEVVLWHTFEEGSSDDKALVAALAKVARETRGYTVTVVRVAPDALYPSLAAQGQSGHGPDLILDQDDDMFSHITAGLFNVWDDFTDGDPDTLADWARDAHYLDGHRWAIPVSAQTVAMFYNADTVKKPLSTTAQLLDLARSGTRIAFQLNCYSAYGFFNAFDGAVFNEDGSTSDRRVGVAQAMAYLRSLKATAGPSFFTNYSFRYEQPFRVGDLDVYVSGTWATPNLRAGLGSKLAVAPLPAAQSTASPLLDFRVFYLGAHSANPKAAVDLALTLSSGEYQKHFMDAAGWVPVRTNMAVSDPAIKGFLDAATAAQRRPQIPEFGAYRAQFCPMFDAIMNLGTDPAIGVDTAFDRIKAQNGR
ncbi:MAG: extracellular solute-binding protein [Thermoflexales bacterium]